MRASIGYLLCALMDEELAGTPFRPLRLHRIYRLRVERHGDQVKLTSRGGLDWTRRFPWIAETARKIRKTHGVGPMRQVSQDRAAAFSFSATSPALRLKRANSGSAT